MRANLFSSAQYPARKYVAELTAEEKESKRKVVVEHNPSLLIRKGEQRSFNGGYLFLQKVYHELGLDKICMKIEKKYRNKYDLDAILQMLLYTRIIYPGSKRSSLEDAKTPSSTTTARMEALHHMRTGRTTTSERELSSRCSRSKNWKDTYRTGP